MKKIALLALASLALSASSVFAADRMMTCAANSVHGGNGVRINLIKASDGKIKATLFFGTTMNSLETYHVRQTRSGFEGQTRDGKRSLEVLVSSKKTQNNYIEGVAAEVALATFTNLQNSSGVGKIENVKIVCGKQVRPYGT